MNLHKISRYLNTVRYLKPSQLYYRVTKTLKMNCSLGAYPKPIDSDDEPSPVDTIEELDFDPVFLARFPVNEIISDRITLLYESEDFHWNEPWNFPNHTPLWNYNLHYFEYLFPLVKAFKDTKEKKYLYKIKTIISAWIQQNPCGTRPGWEPYPTSLRLTNWLSIHAHLGSAFRTDPQFHREWINSIWKQYDFLAHHLEKDLLGNHYFEDLKALILCSLFFRDERRLQKSLAAFYTQCREQILPDGMHFELSPMYHKLIFEDVMRVAAALRGADKKDDVIESYLQSMLDVAYSLEEGLDRIPLFNDCGNNVAKSLDALCEAARLHFGLTSEYKDKLPDSGYYIFKQGDWKLIVDAGQPGPTYLPGHAHCDAMSFELFKAGKPVIVNCGTYAYQCDERNFFRSTAAHNTVQVDGIEQSEYWGPFRMGKRSRTEILDCSENRIRMKLVDQKGNFIIRTIDFGDFFLSVFDLCDQHVLTSFVHPAEDIRIKIDAAEISNTPYSTDFGNSVQTRSVKLCCKNSIKYRVDMISGSLVAVKTK